MLRPPEHQVAGHQASEGRLGPLVDGAGRFYKPLQSDSRGAREAAFYSSFSAHPLVPPGLRSRFFPAFHGLLDLPASDGSGVQPHLALQDLTADLRRPAVLDLKIGARTWSPAVSDDYLQKCLKKDRATTSLQLGFRISGVRCPRTGTDGSDPGYWHPHRDDVRRYAAVEDVRRVLRLFVSSDPAADGRPDCALARVVFGGAEGVLAQLRELKAWFEEQTLFHFYSASLLLLYEREEVEAGRSAGVRVKLVDFAHVEEGNGVIDHNFLGGLCSLIKFISEILDNPNEDLDHSCRVEESKGSQLGLEKRG